MIEEWIEVSAAVNDSERRAFEVLRDMLEPASERFFVITNVRLPNGRNDFYEYDVIIVGEAILFAIEIKGFGGRIVCQRDRWYLENGTSFENPSNRLSIKAKTLGSLLIGQNRGLRGKLWVQDFVYVNGANARLTDVDYARHASFDVIGTSFDESARGALKSALLETGRWNPRAQLFDADERKRITDYLRGGKRRVLDDRIGKYLIEESLVATSERFERMLARDRYEADDAKRVELHVYAIDGRRETDQHLAQELKRQIETVRRLGDLGVAPRWVADDDADRNGRRVHYIAYEWLGDLQTLGDRITSSGVISLREGLRLGIAVAEALATMHDQGVVHGALDPSSLYLRDVKGCAAPQVVIGRTELARPSDSPESSTSIISVDGAASCYASPEVLGNRPPRVDDDLFSFGAILAHILRGRPLFASPAEILQRIRIPRLLDDRSTDPPALQELVCALLARSHANRPSSMREVITSLRMLLGPLEESASERDRIGNYRILRELRAGATGRTVVARRADIDGDVVLKIAPLAQDETLRREVEQLRALLHPNIVVAYNVLTFETEQLTVGEFALVSGEDGERMRARLLGEQIAPLVHGLFSALAHVHAHGLVHRDVKPANIMIGADGKVTLLDFGLAEKPGDENLVVGTAPYKPEAIFARGAWSFADDVFAAAVSVWEIVTGVYPWNTSVPESAPTIDAGAIGALLPSNAAQAFAATIRELILDTPAASNAAMLAQQRLAHALRPAQEALTLPIGPPEIVLPVALQLDDSVSVLAVGVATRRALEALDIVTVGGVRTLRLADLPRVKGFGRGVAEEIQALALRLIARFGEPEVVSGSVMRSVQAPLMPLLPAGTPEERIVSVVFPAWLIMDRGSYVEGVVRLGADGGKSLDLLVAEGGFQLDRETVAVLDAPLVAALPWRKDDLVTVLSELHAACAWPPKDVADIATRLVDLERTRTKMPVLRTMSVETVRLMVERVAPCLHDVALSGDGRLYRRDLFDLADVLAFGAQGVAFPLSLAQLLAAVEQKFPGLRLPSPGTVEFTEAFVSAQFVLLPDGRVERADALEREVEQARPESDLAGVDLLNLSEAARRIVNAVAHGGYRLVVAEPGGYVARVRKLLAELRGTLGERMRIVDFDAELFEALECEGKLAMALRVQRKQGPVPGAIEALARNAAERILDGLLVNERAHCVLLVNAGALALTGATQHLAKVYDRSRGGSHGLVIVCVPGDHPREHARFNRVVPLPIQPTERPIALDEVA